MNTFAIDPGVSGGWAHISSNGMASGHYVSPLNCGQVIREQVQCDHEGILFIIEQVHASPVMSPSSAFAFGENYGVWRGAVAAIGRGQIWGVTPQEWQRTWSAELREAEELHDTPDKRKRARKSTLRKIAARYYPSTKVTLSNCDAILIAHYAMMAKGEVGKIL